MKIDRITSKDNPLLKRLLRAARKEDLVPAEGPKLLQEALSASFPVSNVLFVEDRLSDYEDLLERCHKAGARIIATTSPLLSRLSDTVTSQGIIGFCQPEYSSFPTRDAQGGPLVVLDALQDPGNVGAIIRSALAFGVAGVVLLHGCANPFGSKAVRASAGACFRIPLIRSNHEELLKNLSESGRSVYALERQGTTEVWETELEQNCVIIVGNEGSGISSILMKTIKNSLSIPVDPRLESLNAAVAASVVLYEIARRVRRE